jgi:protein TonB
METRKHPQLDIYRHSGLFFQIGLLVTLLLVVSAFEWRSVQEDPEIDFSNWKGDDIDLILPTKIPEVKRPPKPKKVNIIPATEPDEIKLEELSLDQLESPETPEIEVIISDLPPVEIIEEVDYASQKPEPVGGYDAFYAYIAKNMKYPRIAQQRQVEGKVYVSFLVDEYGNMTNIAIAKGIGSGCDEEALRVMENAPKWIPGRHNGRMVRVRMIVPIHFKLN